MIVDDFARRWAVILATLALAAEDMTALALAGRIAAVRNLKELREALGVEVREATGPALETLWESTNLVQAEVFAIGTKTPEWVEENFPAVPLPHRQYAQAVGQVYRANIASPLTLRNRGGFAG